MKLYKTKIRKRAMDKLVVIMISTMLAFSLWACGTTSKETTSQQDVLASEVVEETATDLTSESSSIDVSQMNIDSSFDESTATKILASNSGFSVEGSGASAEGNTVTITAAGTYLVSGTMADGQIIVDSDGSDAVQIVLNGVDITSTTSAPIYIVNADATTVTVAAGTENYLTDSSSYVYESTEVDEPDATLYSADDLVINGTGTLTVNGNYSHAIKSKDTLVVAETTLILSSVDDALSANEDFTVVSGDITISAGDDGLHSDLILTIEGGTINITNCEEGLEGSSVVINGGDISLISNDDGINAANEEVATHEIVINGGNIYMDSTGDGIDSNGSITMTGGTVMVNGPTNDGNGALDYDSTFDVNGGTLWVAGSSGMAQSTSVTSTQNSLMVIFDSQQAAGTTFTLTDESGAIILEATPTKQYSSILVSSPDLATDGVYNVSADGTQLCSVTISTAVTSISSDGSEASVGMMGGGMGGQMRDDNFTKDENFPQDGNFPEGENMTPPTGVKEERVPIQE